MKVIEWQHLLEELAKSKQKNGDLNGARVLQNFSKALKPAQGKTVAAMLKSLNSQKK